MDIAVGTRPNVSLSPHYTFYNWPHAIVPYLCVNSFLMISNDMPAHASADSDAWRKKGVITFHTLHVKPGRCLPFVKSDGVNGSRCIISR